jgi:hypothetical protein
MEPLTVPAILASLRSLDEYKDLSDYYIKKKIKEKLNVKTVNKPELLRELDSHFNKSIFNKIPKDVVPQIINDMPVTKARSISKHFLQHNQQRFEDATKQTIYNYIINYFTENMFNNADITVDITTYEDFKTDQYNTVLLLTNNDITFINYIIKKIKNKELYNMDKEDMTPYLVEGIMFINGKLTTRNGDINLKFNKKLPKFTKPKLSTTKLMIANFIEHTFDDYDYDRFQNYNEEETPFKSLKHFIQYQYYMVSQLSITDVDFLLQCRHKILQSKLLQTDNSVIIDWTTSGFIIIDGKIVLFHER